MVIASVSVATAVAIVLVAVVISYILSTFLPWGLSPLCDYMIAYRNGFVKRFLKKVFSFFLKKGVDILIEVWYHLISGRDKATPKGRRKARGGPPKTTAFGIGQVRPRSRFFIAKMLRPLNNTNPVRSRPRPDSQKETLPPRKE